MGANPTAAVYGGISPARITMLVMALSGALAGGVAVNEIMGVQNRLLGASGEAMEEDAAFAVVDGQAGRAVVVGRAARRPAPATRSCFEAAEKALKVGSILLAACAGSE